MAVNNYYQTDGDLGGGLLDDYGGWSGDWPSDWSDWWGDGTLPPPSWAYWGANSGGGNNGNVDDRGTNNGNNNGAGSAGSATPPQPTSTNDTFGGQPPEITPKPMDPVSLPGDNKLPGGPSPQTQKILDAATKGLKQQSNLGMSGGGGSLPASIASYLAPRFEPGKPPQGLLLTNYYKRQSGGR